MRMRLFLGSLLLLAGLGFYASPYLTLQQMRTAAAERDAGKLARHVDFEALKASLKAGVQARLIGDERNAQGQPPPANVMGAAVAGALLGPMVDTLITPDSLARMLQGQSPATAALPQVGAPTAPTTAAEPLDTRMGYESPNRFVYSVTKQGSGEEAIHLVLRRDGLLAWKLAELRLP